MRPRCPEAESGSQPRHPTDPVLRPCALHLLLSVALAWELSCTTGRASPDCPETTGQLGASVLLLLNPEGGHSQNTSMHVVVTVAKSLDSKVRRKLVSIDLPERGGPGYLEAGYRLQLEPLSLQILQSGRDDEGWYSISLERNVTVQHFCWHLQLYEQISSLEIQVLNHTQDSGNCSVTLACLATRGDNVTYMWSRGAGSPLLDTANSSQRLHLVLDPQDMDDLYICTASNPVSSQARDFVPHTLCTRQSAQKWWLSPLGVFLGLIVVVIPVAVWLRKGKAKQDQPAEKAPSHTIYTTLQKAGSLHRTAATPAPQENPCSSIYVAALTPVSESAQPKPHPPHSPPGPSFITVYASMALPES